MKKQDYYILDPQHVLPERLKREREKARHLRKTAWWLGKLNRGICEYCGEKFGKSDLTMDHKIPLARGGKSTKGNLILSCYACNQKKKLKTPVEDLFERIEKEKREENGSGE